MSKKTAKEISVKDLWELANRIEESMGHEDANLLRSFLKRMDNNGKEEVNYQNAKRNDR